MITITEYILRWRGADIIGGQKNFSSPERREKYRAWHNGFYPKAEYELTEYTREIPENCFVVKYCTDFSKWWKVKYERFDNRAQADAWLDEEKPKHSYFDIEKYDYDDLFIGLYKMYDAEPNARLEGRPRMGYSNTDARILGIKEVL